MCTRLRIYFLLSFCLTIILFSSCHKNIPKKELNDNYTNIATYSELFDVFWRTMNNQYIFWDKDTIDWNETYKIYKPKFAALDTLAYSQELKDTMMQYFVDMTKDLKDAKFSLTINGGASYTFEGKYYQSYLNFVPKLIRTNAQYSKLPDTLFDYIIPKKYLFDFDYGVYTQSNIGNFQITTGNIYRNNKKILFCGMNYASAMKESYTGYSIRPARPVIKNFFANANKNDGIIIDLRNNIGGNQEDIGFLAGHLTTKTYEYGYFRFKTAEGKFDFSPLIPITIFPQQDAVDVNKKIVILTNKYTAMVAENMVEALRNLPNATVVVVGEPTYGAAGNYEYTYNGANAGTFYVGNVLLVQLSNTGILNHKQEFNFNGIQPDVVVAYDADKITQMKNTGVDIQLEEAINQLVK